MDTFLYFVTFCSKESAPKLAEVKDHRYRSRDQTHNHLFVENIFIIYSGIMVVSDYETLILICCKYHLLE